MAKVEDCPGFETFGADVKAARKARHLARKALAEMVGIEWRYNETHSAKWTVRIAIYYICMALLMSFVVYHVAALFL